MTLSEDYKSPPHFIAETDIIYGAKLEDNFLFKFSLSFFLKGNLRMSELMKEIKQV